MDDAITTAEAKTWTDPGRGAPAAPAPERDDGWRAVLAHLRGETRRCSGPYAAMFEPLLAPSPDGLTVVGQLGQSLDGRIATVTGHSRWINGDHGLRHLHRLRAVVEAVMVGIGTASFDDPMLNTRLVEGDSPARIVIDPRGRLDAKAKLLREDGRRRIVITGAEARSDLPRGVEQVRLPMLACGSMQPTDILRVLKSLGFSRVLLEGGAHTVSRFLDAGCLDRLHVIVAPVIIGAGHHGLSLPEIEVMDHARRPATRPHLLGDEVLFDCDLTPDRVRLA